MSAHDALNDRKLAKERAIEADADAERKRAADEHVRLHFGSIVFGADWRQSEKRKEALKASVSRAAAAYGETAPAPPTATGKRARKTESDSEGESDDGMMAQFEASSVGEC